MLQNMLATLKLAVHSEESQSRFSLWGLKKPKLNRPIPRAVRNQRGSGAANKSARVPQRIITCTKYDSGAVRGTA